MDKWWVYDETNADEPGWKQWEIVGRFKTPPAKHLDSSDIHVLARADSLWKVWAVESEAGIVHEVEHEGGTHWGKVHKALTVETVGLEGRERWIQGPTALMAQIDDLLGDTEFMDKLPMLRARSESAPLSWAIGSRPDAAWSSSMELWAVEWDRLAATAMAEDLGHPAYNSARLAREAFMIRLAAGSQSPSQTWLDGMDDPRSLLIRPWGVELGTRMQALEIAAQACLGHAAPVKAMRI